MKVSVTLAGTFPIVAGNNYLNIKPSVSFDEIDTEEELGPQLEKARIVALAVAAEVEATLAQAMANASGLSVEGLGLSNDFRALEDKVNKIADTVRSHHKVLRDQENARVATTPREVEEKIDE